VVQLIARLARLEGISVAVYTDRPNFYSATEALRQRCLRDGDSLFTPGRRIWSVPNTNELYSRTVEQPDFSPGKFLPKLETQLAGTDDDVKQLAAELLYTRLLIEHRHGMGMEGKQSQIGKALGWLQRKVTLSPELTAALDEGLVNTGSAKSQAWWQLAFLIEFARRWSEEPERSRHSLLGDPWAFKAFVAATPGRASQTQREALLYLVHPEAFEDITSASAKQEIVESFSNAVAEPAQDVDKALLQIRNTISPRYGKEFSFYQDDLKQTWQSGSVSNVLRQILQGYSSARQTETFGKASKMWRLFDSLKTALEKSDPVRSRPYLQVEPSVGKGNWSKVPWVALLDKRVTKSTRDGTYAVLLFREDMTGLYLTLNQGVDRPNRELGRTEAASLLQSRAAAIRQAIPSLGTSFQIDDTIDLRSDGLGSDYEKSTIAHQLYEAERLPDDEAITDDLEELLAGYDEYVNAFGVAPSKTTAWIFQANPAFYDIARSVREHRDMTWLVRQNRSKIAKDQRVFVWEAGREAGIIAIAHTTADPADMVEDAGMEPYVRNTEKFAGAQPRVWIRIDEVLPERITRAQLIDHPTLRELTILKAPQGSNFPVSAEQETALLLLAKRDIRVPHDVSVFKPEDALAALLSAIADMGFVFEPWHVAAYVTAMRTKPFVILAGVSGTGKSRLPALVAGLTGGASRLIPVRPDWTDSSDVIGYVDLKGDFRPGSLLSLAREAASKPREHFVCILDEMNLARVEHYFAEVLSAMEDRRPADGGGYESGALLMAELQAHDKHWAGQRLPSNIAIAGTVNMDESAHGFSRKVIDRAFTLEFADLRLDQWLVSENPSPPAARWPAEAWHPRAARLGELNSATDTELETIKRVVSTLEKANESLLAAQLQVGYRTRDEVALFLIHAKDFETHFVSSAGEVVDPLDVALQMKLLPRISGGSGPVRRCLTGLLLWASNVEKAGPADVAAKDVVESWIGAKRPLAIAGARFPRTAARLSLMWERMEAEGFTSYWV
jgi:hypothetical protein